MSLIMKKKELDILAKGVKMPEENRAHMGERFGITADLEETLIEMAKSDTSGDGIDTIKEFAREQLGLPEDRETSAELNNYLVFVYGRAAGFLKGKGIAAKKRQADLRETFGITGEIDRIAFDTVKRIGCRCGRCVSRIEEKIIGWVAPEEVTKGFKEFLGDYVNALYDRAGVHGDAMGASISTKHPSKL